MEIQLEKVMDRDKIADAIHTILERTESGKKLKLSSSIPLLRFTVTPHTSSRPNHSRQEPNHVLWTRKHSVVPVGFYIPAVYHLFDANFQIEFDHLFLRPIPRTIHLSANQVKQVRQNIPKP